MRPQTPVMCDGFAVPCCCMRHRRHRMAAAGADPAPDFLDADADAETSDVTVESIAREEMVQILTRVQARVRQHMAGGSGDGVAPTPGPLWACVVTEMPGTGVHLPPDGTVACDDRVGE